MRKGILLSGGMGTRLAPSTNVVSKQLIPVYDKPMIYYSLSCLMLAGIRHIMLISTPSDLPSYKKLFGDGEKWGIQFEYAAQEKPEGIAQSFLIAEDFLGDDPVMLVLGDNVFHGANFGDILKSVSSRECSTIFGCRVIEPHRYGIAELAKDGTVLSIQEKPQNPKSNIAVPGIYCYDNTVVEKAKVLKKSLRGELEITDVNNLYIQENKLKLELLSKEFAWFDSGTHESLMDSACYVMAVEKRQGIKICCPEEIAFDNGWISKKELESLGMNIKSSYGNYLVTVAKNHVE